MKGSFLKEVLNFFSPSTGTMKLRKTLKNMGNLLAKIVEKSIFSKMKLTILLARSKTRKAQKSWKSQNFFSEIFKSEFSILAVGKNKKLGNKKTWNNFSKISQISDVSEFSICHFFIFFRIFFPFSYSFFQIL